MSWRSTPILFLIFYFVDSMFWLLTPAAVVWQKLELEFGLNLAVCPLFLSVGLEGLLVPGAAIEVATTTPHILHPACNFLPACTFAWIDRKLLVIA